MSRIGYDLLPLDNLVSGLLREDKSHRQAPRAVDKWFICERCNGEGQVSVRKGESESCDLCKGSGKIQLRMTVERI